MKPPRPPRRSVSPFGTQTEADEKPFPGLAHALGTDDNAKPKPPKKLSTTEDLPFVPTLLRRLMDAPAYDAPEMAALCSFIVTQTPAIEEKAAGELMWNAMNELFDRKTELFLIDHQDKAYCEKLGLADDYRDIVLYSKERDTLIGQFFAPATERQPGKFSEFVHRWVETDNPDRLLHFIDFCAGSKNPTFEYFLLSSHPALNRILNNKAQLRALFEKTRPILAKLTSPTWETDVKKALGI